VEGIQHFADHPQHCNTQREDQNVGHLLISSCQPEQLRGEFSVDEFSVELSDAVSPALVFAEFCLCDAAESFLF
jgi:hypothetical protein